MAFEIFWRMEFVLLAIAALFCASVRIRADWAIASLACMGCLMIPRLFLPATAIGAGCYIAWRVIRFVNRAGDPHHAKRLPDAP